MIERDLTIVNRLGLHARAAGQFVQRASKFRSKILVVKDGLCVDGKSILGLLTLAGSQGSTLKMKIDGDDEDAAMRELVALIEGHFGENF